MKRPPVLQLMILAMSLFCWWPANVYSQQPGVARVESTFDQDQVWIGQKVILKVKVAVPGPFSGATSFSLPEVPLTTLFSVGGPVVSSEQVEGETWFVQTHEIAVFSQSEGKLQIPEFQVRFANRETFTGPAQSHSGQVPQASIDVKRPAAVPDGMAIVTTTRLTVSQQWEPEGGVLRPGDMIHRTISQSAADQLALALEPPSRASPSGVRAYWADPEIENRMERGAFECRRQDSVDYVVQSAGLIEFPALKIHWYDPQSDAYRFTELEAKVFQVQADPAQVTTGVASNRQRRTTMLVVGLTVVGALMLIVVWVGQKALVRLLHQLRCLLISDEDLTIRRLIRSCRANDAQEACRLWLEWNRIARQRISPSVPMKAEITEMWEHRYGASNEESWDGQKLAEAICDYRRITRLQRTSVADDPLPTLNPTSGHVC